MTFGGEWKGCLGASVLVGSRALALVAVAACLALAVFHSGGGFAGSFPLGPVGPFGLLSGGVLGTAAIYGPSGGARAQGATPFGCTNTLAFGFASGFALGSSSLTFHGATVAGLAVSVC